MNKTRLLLGVLGLTFLFIGLFSCSVSKAKHSEDSLVQNPPFKIVETYSTNWIAGVEGGGSGTILFITFLDLKKKVIIEDLFFRNIQIKAQRDRNNQLIYLGYFKNELNSDVIMDANVIKEAQNTPPKKIPFQLKENEAIISYTYKGTLQFYKVSNITEEEVIAFPETKPKID